MLNKEQTEFLQKLIPLCNKISEYTKLKGEFLGIETPVGFHVGLLIAEIIIQSDWGRKEISQPIYINRYSNNLALLPGGQYWQGKTNCHEGIEYRAYKDWKTFAIDYSDYLTFSRGFDDVLKEYGCRRQIELFSLTKNNPQEYTREVIEIINVCSEAINGRKVALF